METPLYRKPYYKKFYSPLDRSLKEVGVLKIAPRNHGWVDRYRTYRTDYSSLRYVLTHDNDDGLAWVGVAADGDGELLDILLTGEEQMRSNLGCSNLLWEGPFDIPGIFVTSEAHFGDSSDKQKMTREWMFETLVMLRHAIKSCLDALVDERPKSLTDLIAAAPWREAVTYRETWPHEYVLLQKDGERQLMRAVWQRMYDGEAFNGYFFSRPTIYLFIGDYKYWFMSSLDTINAMLEDEDHDTEVVLNRARLYHDRRDFYIQYGDTGMRDDYPGPPYWMKQNDTDATGADTTGE